MNNIFKLKIKGNSPTTILIAVKLAKLNHKIYIFNDLSDSAESLKDKVFFIDHNTKEILEKYNLWIKLKPKMTSFNSIMIRDNQYSKNLIFDLNYNKLHNERFKEFGWNIDYSSFMEVLIKELYNFKNITLIGANNKKDYIDYFDYEFTSLDILLKNNYKKKYKFLNNIRQNSYLSLKVLLRGHTQNRRYEIYFNDNKILLFPLKGNLYQLFWKSNSSNLKNKLNTSKSLLQDNLSSVLPLELNIDEIIGDIVINKYYYSLSYPDLITNNNIIFNECMQPLNEFLGYQIISSSKDINNICNIFRVNGFNKLNINKYIKIRFTLKRYFNILRFTNVKNYFYKILSKNYLIYILYIRIMLKLLTRFHFLGKKILRSICG